jgi:hypothetical protein
MLLAAAGLSALIIATLVGNIVRLAMLIRQLTEDGPGVSAAVPRRLQSTRRGTSEHVGSAMEDDRA